MRVLLVVSTSMVLWSCQSKNTSAASAPGAPSENQQSAASQESKRDGGVIVLDQTEQQKGHVVAELVRIKEVAETLVVSGRLTVSDDQTWHVGAIAGGRVDELSARLGDFARVGQILGRIHSHDVHEARAGYQQALTELERTRSAEGYAAQRRDRAQRLLELRAGSRQDLETAEADLRNAQAAIEKAQSELGKERAHLTILRVPIDEPASDAAQHGDEDDVPIIAPASGIVLERRATVGSVVNAGDELLALTDPSSLWMIAAANEADLSKLRPGQGARVEVRAYPDRGFAGRILQLGEQLDPVTRTLQIRIVVPNQQGLLKPEMYATARLQQSGRRSAAFVPEEAIQDIDGVPAVFVRRSQNSFEARLVKIGQHSGGETEILEGLNAGEAVVVKSSFLLKSQMLRSRIRE
jgi:multidrug efflux pump subunit AcrA (membrane-fusion protein)